MIVRFHPQAWQNDYAVSVDPLGPTEWTPTESYVLRLALELGASLLRPDTYASDELRLDPGAPEWVRNWAGPFYCEPIPEAHR